MKSATLFVVLMLCGSTNGFAQRHGSNNSQALAKSVSGTIPSIQTQTVKVLKSPAWDYIIWTDDSEKRHLRAKLLTANETTVHLANLEGTTVIIPVSKFSKADRELIGRYTAKETAILTSDADHDELIEAIKTAMTVPDDTTIRRTAESERRRAEFLKRYNGTPFVLCLPISDISQQAAGGGFLGGAIQKLPEGQYRLLFGEETIWVKPSRGAGYLCQPGWPLPGGGVSNANVRLTASQAAWVNKGDKLIVKGTADFTFKDASTGGWLNWWCHSNLNLHLNLRGVSLSLTREEPDTTLADAVAARVAQFKAVQAAEAAEAAKKAAEVAEKAARQTDPFK